MLKFILPAISLMIVSGVRAEEINLDCTAKLASGHKYYSGRINVTFHLYIDDDGVTYIQVDGGRTYHTNKNSNFFRRNKVEIVWGDESTECVINRKSGEYRATVNLSLYELGTCEKSKVDSSEQKF